MDDSSSFFNHMRMESLRVGPRIQKSDTNFWGPGGGGGLEPGLELASKPRS